MNDHALALVAIHQQAKDARNKLAGGEALNGVSALRRIEEIAQDALRDVEYENSPDAVAYP